MAASPQIRVVAERRSGSDGWSVYRGDEWFAHATSRADVLRYVSDILYEGTGPRGSVWRQIEAMEMMRDD